MIKKDKDIVKEIEQQIYLATDEEYKNIADELENMSYTKTPSGILKKTLYKFKQRIFVFIFGKRIQSYLERMGLC